MDAPTLGKREPQVEDAGVLWKRCAELLREQVSEPVFLTCFNAIDPLARTHDTLVIAVPNSLIRERIESRYRSLVETCLAEAGGDGLRLQIDVREAPTIEPDPLERAALDELSPSMPEAAGVIDPVDDVEVLGAGGTATVTGTVATASPPAANPTTTTVPDATRRYTFDAFVTGSSNRFAQAAALAVAETPAKSYNPLFIYGDAGLGKTHLLMAIANYVREHYPHYIVRYVSCETYLNEFVDSIRNNSQPLFKQRYREVDVLLIDDIQFIEGRESLQEELFHNFEHLHQAARQIVLSSDRPPDAISTLHHRLRGRFKMGLITDIQPPDVETRLAILQKKAETESVDVPPDVLELIATNITENIRELEGALIRVCAYGSLNHEQLTLELAERVLHDVLTDKKPRPITPELILEKTSEKFGFSVDELQGQSRRRPLVTARQISMYVFRELTELSYPAIAREFGGRDHTTVIHAVDKIRGQMKERRQIYDQVTELTQLVRSGA